MMTYSRRVYLCVALLVSSCTLVGGLANPVRASGARGDDYPSTWKNAPQHSVVDTWRQYNRGCTSWVAWALHSRNGFELPWVKGSAGAADWGYAERSGYAADRTPRVGSVAWWDHGNGTGHVAWVAGVHQSAVTIEEYNGSKRGNYSIRTIRADAPTGYIHFKDLDSPPKPSVLSVKRSAAPDGVRQVYAATASTVTEAWWTPGGAVRTSEIIHISQGNIVDMDKTHLPDGTQTVYTATATGIWETWWRPGTGLHSSQIVSGLKDIRQIIVDNRYEHGEFVHRLYALARDGPHEIWWKDGGDGIHHTLLNSITDPVTMVNSNAPGGAYQLYVATPTYVFELSWDPGAKISHRPIIHISQGDIRSLDKDAYGSDGQLLYTGTSTSAWQSYWSSGSGIETHEVLRSQPATTHIKKSEYDGVQQLYHATNSQVQEHWWTDSGRCNTSTIISTAQPTIRTFDKFNDGTEQQVYTAAGDIVYETWWRGGDSPSGLNTAVLFKVVR